MDSLLYNHRMPFSNGSTWVDSENESLEQIIAIESECHGFYAIQQCQDTGIAHVYRNIRSLHDEEL